MNRLIELFGWNFLEGNKYIFLDNFWYSVYILKKPVIKSFIDNFKTYKFMKS